MGFHSPLIRPYLLGRGGYLRLPWLQVLWWYPMCTGNLLCKHRSASNYLLESNIFFSQGMFEGSPKWKETTLQGRRKHIPSESQALLSRWWFSGLPSWWDMFPHSLEGIILHQSGCLEVRWVSVFHVPGSMQVHPTWVSDEFVCGRIILDCYMICKLTQQLLDNKDIKKYYSKILRMQVILQPW